MSNETITRVPLDQFGRDHWSLLTYIETVCVDGSGAVGRIDLRRVRANPARHPFHAVNAASLSAAWRGNWGTRLRGHTDAAPNQLGEHDDWDCLDDLDAAGLVETVSFTNGFVRLTPAGIRVAAQLRAHKARGGVLANFVPAAG